MALLLGLFAALCWSIHDLAARRYAPTLGPFRLGVATELAGFVMALAFLLPLPAASMAEWLLLALLGVIYGTAVAGLFKAFAMAPVSIVGPFTAGYPALVVIWGMLHGLSPSLSQTLAILAILAGGIVVGRSGHDDGGMNAIEGGRVWELMFWVILADICFAASIVLGQKLGPVFGDFKTAALLRVPAALTLLLFARRETSQPHALGRWGVLIIFIMAGLDLASLTGINAMGSMPGKEFGAMGISAYGGLATILAMLFLKERVSLGQWLGIGLIALGVALLGVQIG